jgi:peptidoglycan hydrolase-like protein with peptidoglycan-binding domain
LGDADDTRLAQELLSELGYEPGPIDGVLGQSTQEAIKEFQGDSGLSQDGEVDAVLLSALKGSLNVRSLITNRDSASQEIPQASTGILALGIPANARLINGGVGWECNTGYARDGDVCVSQERRPPPNTTPAVRPSPSIVDSTTNSVVSQTFTRGSHEDDVLRLQGTPDQISVYRASGYESWQYGRSTVEISISDRRVREWNDRGNLRVD